MIISSGTLLTRDLILAFESAIPTEAAIPAEARDDRNHSWWYSEAAQWELDDLFDTLMSNAPDGTYFGESKGDGACFGFWPIEDEE
jgi:hypothetical protein